VSRVDPKDIASGVGAGWDLRLLRFGLSYNGGLSLQILTHGDAPSGNLHTDTEFMLVKIDLNNDGASDVNISTANSMQANFITFGSGGTQEYWRGRVNLNTGTRADKCRTWFRVGGEPTFAVGVNLYLEQWRGGKSGAKCGFPLKKKIGFQVETWNQGRVVDRLPNSGRFLYFNGDYNQGLKCNLQNFGVKRANLPWAKKKYSYCAQSNGAWVWQDTKPKPVVPIVPGPPSKSPKK
jgi:hypothetical protein